jgi:hypothetical protein
MKLAHSRPIPTGCTPRNLRAVRGSSRKPRGRPRRPCGACGMAARTASGEGRPRCRRAPRARAGGAHAVGTCTGAGFGIVCSPARPLRTAASSRRAGAHSRAPEMTPPRRRACEKAAVVAMAGRGRRARAAAPASRIVIPVQRCRPTVASAGSRAHSVSHGSRAGRVPSRANRCLYRASLCLCGRGSRPHAADFRELEQRSAGPPIKTGAARKGGGRWQR